MSFNEITLYRCAERPRLQPPAHLTPNERALFQQVVNENDPAAFAPSDAILVASYVQATMLAAAWPADPIQRRCRCGSDA